jgi:uncharacterized membrane protein YgdD (TMEM256/DUF423 family)
MARWFMILAGLSGAAGVGFSAMAAHALQGQLTAQAVDWVETAGTYLLLHAPALAICAILTRQRQSRRILVAGILFATGLAGFSGGLLLLALADIRQAIAIVPVGGTFLLFGWLALASTALTWTRDT